MEGGKVVDFSFRIVLGTQTMGLGGEGTDSQTGGEFVSV